MSYDHHIENPTNYGVTEEDVSFIPNATYNDNPNSGFTVSKNSAIGEYGVWINHYFVVDGVIYLGEFFGGNFYIRDEVTAHGFIDSDSWDDVIPTGSATYSGQDNFIGADMSSHYLGALLRADANLIYQFGSHLNSNMGTTKNRKSQK